MAIANIGALWLGRSFKVGIGALVVSAFVVTWLWVRHRRRLVVRNLADADKETQDAALAELEADDRRDILRGLGRDT